MGQQTLPPVVTTRQERTIHQPAGHIHTFLALDNYHFPPLSPPTIRPNFVVKKTRYRRIGFPQNSSDELPFVRVLGQGGEGLCTLHRANSASQELVVVKQSNPLRATSTANRTLITNEVNILVSLIREKNGRKRRANIIEILGTIASSRRDFCIMKFSYCEGGTLADLIDKHIESGTLPSRAFVRHVQLQLSVALAFIHRGCTYDYVTMRWNWPRRGDRWIPVVHRDIKPDNILLSHTNKSDPTSEFPDIVLGDFGHAIALEPFESHFSDHNTYAVLGCSKVSFSTQVYCPPEYFQRKAGEELEPDEAFDWWQLGATLFELCMHCLYSSDEGRLPYYCGLAFTRELSHMLERDAYWRFNDDNARNKLAEWQRIRDQEDTRDRKAGPRRDASWGSTIVTPYYELIDTKKIGSGNEVGKCYKSFSSASYVFFE